MCHDNKCMMYPFCLQVWETIACGMRVNLDVSNNVGSTSNQIIMAWLHHSPVNDHSVEESSYRRETTHNTHYTVGMEILL